MQIKEIHPNRAIIQEIVSKLPAIVQFPETKEIRGYTEWTPATILFLSAARAELHKLTDTALKQKTRELLRLAVRSLQQLNPPVSHKEAQVLVKQCVTELSRVMSQDIALTEVPTVQEQHLSLQELATKHPNLFSLTESSYKGVSVCVLQTRLPSGEILGETLIPSNPRIQLKGGPARRVLKAIAGVPERFQRSEYPASDLDALILTGDHKTYAEAQKLGISSSGMELVSHLHFSEFCAGRDVEPNQVLLSAHGLHYSQKAYDALQSGLFTVSGLYVPGKALYGADTYPVKRTDGTVSYLYKPRASARIMKFISEEKLYGIEFPLVNSKYFDFGLYTLFLVDKWSKKKNLSVYAQRMFYLMSEMGQLKNGEQSCEQLLESAHERYPFFKFDSSFDDDESEAGSDAVLEWLLRKLAKQVDREQAARFHLSSGFSVDIPEPELDMTKRISLDGFVYDAAAGEQFASWLPQFKKRCKKTADSLPPQTNLERIFFRNQDIDYDVIVR